MRRTVTARSSKSDSPLQGPLQLIPSTTPSRQWTGTRSAGRLARALQISTGKNPVVVLVKAITARSGRGVALSEVVTRKRGLTSGAILERNQLSDTVAVVFGEIHIHANGIGCVNAENVFDGVGKGSSALVFAVGGCVEGDGIGWVVRC